MSSVARDGRRRRLLQEGLIQEPAAVALPATNGATDGARGGRYAALDASPAAAAVAALAPRSGASIAGLSVLLAAAAISLAAFDRYTAADPGSSPTLRSLAAADRPASLAAWWGSTVWLAVAGASAGLFALRRGRLDDVACGYRWWLLGAAAALVLSGNSATHAHAALAEAVSARVGVAPLGGALWWLLPAALVGGAVALRLAIDLAECRPALALAGSAGASIAVGWAVEVLSLGGALGSASSLGSSLGSLAALSGASLALLALAAYTRRIVLESRGESSRHAARDSATAQSVTPKTVSLKTVNPKTATPKPAEPTRLGLHAADDVPEHAVERREASDADAEQAGQDDPGERVGRRRKEQRRESSRQERAGEGQSAWVTGGSSGIEEEDYDDDGPRNRRPSKAERKMLRAQREQRDRRAA